MRRPPEVGQAGLLVILLLGASGCAGFPQRTIGSSPWSAPAGRPVRLAAGPLLVVAPGQLAKRRGTRPLRPASPNRPAPDSATLVAESADGESLARNAIGMGGSQLPSIQPDLERKHRPAAPVKPATRPTNCRTSRAPNNRPMSDDACNGIGPSVRSSRSTD